MPYNGGGSPGYRGDFDGLSKTSVVPTLEETEDGTNP